MAEVTAVAVNFNRCADVVRCVESLLQQTSLASRIVVIDNASTDNSVTTLNQRFPSEIEILSLPKNLGASGGFDAGIQNALTKSCDRILLLDSDVFLHPNCLQSLNNAFAQNPSLGIAGPKVYHWDSSSIIQECGGWIDWEQSDLRRNHFRHDESTSGLILNDETVDYIPACCLLVSRAAIEATQSFDPTWFLYWDDIEFCYRIQKSGYTIKSIASAKIQHFGGGANKRNLIPVYYGWRNRFTFIRLHCPVEKRTVCFNHLIDDFLLAHFTCQNLGLPNTASMMKTAVEDSLSGIRGIREFTAAEIALDVSIPQTQPDPVRIKTVHHIIGSASEELASTPDLVLKDRFGKTLSAAQAFELKQRFTQIAAAEKPPLLKRLSQPL